MSIFNSLKNIFGGDENSPRNRARRFRLLHTFEKLPDFIESLAFSPDGALLAAGCMSEGAWLWSLKNRTLLHILRGPKYRPDVRRPERDFAYTIAFSPDGQFLVGGGFAGTICVWRVADGQLLHNWKSNIKTSPFAYFRKEFVKIPH
jgi:WD40 repeat protein